MKQELSQMRNMSEACKVQFKERIRDKLPTFMSNILFRTHVVENSQKLIYGMLSVTAVAATVTLPLASQAQTSVMMAESKCSDMHTGPETPSIQIALENFVRTHDADIGIAVITNRGDTVCLNNGRQYPMNSVMKLYQAMAVADEMQRRGHRLDSMITVSRKEMEEDTYSPMRDRYPRDDFRISIADLLKYSLQQSDNNACDILFRHIIGIPETDRYIRSLGISGFAISASEADMHSDTTRVHENWNHPIAAAMLINRLFTDPVFDSDKRGIENSGKKNSGKKNRGNKKRGNENRGNKKKGEENRGNEHDDIGRGRGRDNIYQCFLTETLNGCTTGENRLARPLLPTNAVIGHKTGTGFPSADGHPQGINDVGFVRLPNGRSYSIAVFVKSSRYGMEETERLIAKVSEIVWREVYGE